MLCPAVEAVLSLVAVRGVGREEWGGGWREIREKMDLSDLEGEGWNQ